MKFLLPKAPAFAEHFQEMSVCLAEIAAVFNEFSIEFRDFEKYWLKSALFSRLTLYFVGIEN